MVSLSFPVERKETVGCKHHSQELQQTLLFCHEQKIRARERLSRAESQP